MKKNSVIEMSEKKKVEFTKPPRSIGGDGIAVSVRFNYPDGKGWRGNLTVHAETEEELKEELKKAYHWHYPSDSTEQLVKDYKDKKDIDWE